MTEQICDNCHTKIPEGGLFYRVRTEIVSGFDNCIADSPDPDGDIKRACDCLTDCSEKDMLAQVYEEISLLLCPACRKTLRTTLTGMQKQTFTRHKILPFTKPRPK